MLHDRWANQAAKETDRSLLLLKTSTLPSQPSARTALIDGPPATAIWGVFDPVGEIGPGQPLQQPNKFCTCVAGSINAMFSISRGFN
jgi:hypothetical protein